MDYSQYRIDDFLMDESFQEYARGTNPESVALWNQIIDQFPEKKQEISEARQILESFAFRKTAIAPGQYQEDENKLKKAIEKQVTAKHRQLRPRSRNMLRFAATLALLILAGIFLYQYFIQLKNEGQSQPLAFIDKTVPKGQKLTIFLDDGTKVKINANSTLKVPEHFSADKREVFLEGEAFFEVKKDPARPFTIYSGNTATTVLGTSFNISAYPNRPVVKVAVVTGKVKVENNNPQINGNNTLFLLPEEMATYSLSSGDLTKSSYIPDQEIGWNEGIIYFENTPLSEVIDMLENWYGVTITADSQVDQQEIYTGTFKDESLENVLNALKERAKFNYSINNAKVNLYGL